MLGTAGLPANHHQRACKEAGSSACMRRLTAVSTRAFRAGSEQRTSPVLQSTTTWLSPTCAAAAPQRCPWPVIGGCSAIQISEAAEAPRWRLPFAHINQSGKCDSTRQAACRPVNNTDHAVPTESLHSATLDMGGYMDPGELLACIMMRPCSASTWADPNCASMTAVSRLTSAAAAPFKSPSSSALRRAFSALLTTAGSPEACSKQPTCSVSARALQL